MNHMPRRVLAVSCLEHHVARPGIVIPAPVRLEVHWAQFPLPKRIVDARLESPFLLVLANLQPDLDQSNPGVHDVFLYRRAQVEEALVLRLAAKAHDVFDAGPVIPAAVKDDDLARCRESLNVALHEHLSLLAIRGRGQCSHAKDTRAHPLCNSLDRPALARGVAPFEQDDDPRTRLLDPILQPTKLHLQLVQSLFHKPFASSYRLHDERLSRELHPGPSLRFLVSWD